MTTTVILAALTGAGFLVWILLRRHKKAEQRGAWVRKRGPELLFAIVGPSEKNDDPYPYVYVNANGTARDLGASERAYLETAFRPDDSGRPYVKSRYEQKNGWGEIRGFMQRAKLPSEVGVETAPDAEATPVSDPTDGEELPERFLQFPKTHTAWSEDEDDDARSSRG